MSLYKVLLVIHVFSAILGLGPGFVMIYVVTDAKTMSQLRHSYKIRHRIHFFVMVGGTLLLITGLLMGWLNPLLWKQIWYVGSLVLFLIALAAGPLILSPLSKPIKAMLQEVEGEKVPSAYEVASQKLFFFERMTNIIFLLIIFLMIAKPF